MTGAASQPYLHAAGHDPVRTYADALYVYVEDMFADVFAIEVCKSWQNFNDKRARHNSLIGNTQITLKQKWLGSAMTLQNGSKKKLWEASGWFQHAPLSDVTLPLRHYRGLFALTDADYAKFKDKEYARAHEYFCRHAHIKQQNNQEMREFIKGMASVKHYRS